MNELDEQLQERLAQLEAGEPLTTAGAGLPAEVVETLAFAAALQDVALPEPDETAVIAHRAAAIRAAQQMKLPQNEADPTQTGGFSAFWAWWRGHQLVALGAAAAAAVLFFLYLGSLVTRDTFTPVPIAERDDDQPAPSSESDGASLFERLFGADEATETDSVVEAPLAETAESTVDAAAEQAAVPEAEPGFQTFLPVLTEPLQTGPTTAVLGNLQGVVSVQKPDGSWEPVSYLSSVATGSRVRTGAFSSASLTFFDGSVAKLGPNSELSLDTVNALRPENGFRTVVMTQWQGTSSHDVEFRNDSGSQYEVKSPNGTGIARGTIFEVAVLPDLTSRYTVLEGRVDVTSISVTVSVMAGQLSTILPDEPPAAPVFQVSGEGEVTEIGESWIIGGQLFATDDQTVIVGNPQVGDWVTVQGHLLDDGTKVADQIVLVREVPESAFTLTAVVTEMGADQWLLGDLVVLVDADTAVADDIAPGDWVRVTGIIQADGTLLAQRIQKQTDDGKPFEFTGVVQTIGDARWQISGVDVAISDRTEIEADLAVGDVVKVEGQITAEGVWLAREIKLADDDDDEDTAEFEFTGLVETVEPWVVAGIALATDEWTEIDTAVAPGSRVKVEGVILPDGTWLAEEIKLLDDDGDADEIILRFTGIVESTEPWVVNGITLLLADGSHIAEGVTTGTLVQVAARLAADGSWEIVWIRPLLPPTSGCFTVHTRITAVVGGQITLMNWPTLTLDDAVVVEGNLAPDSTISITICVGHDGTIVVVNIIVIQVIVHDLPPGDEHDDDGDSGGNGRVTICHKGNTLTISQSGLNGHLGHGDTVGACRQGDDDDHDDDHDDDDDDD